MYIEGAFILGILQPRWLQVLVAVICISSIFYVEVNHPTKIETTFSCIFREDEPPHRKSWTFICRLFYFISCITHLLPNPFFASWSPFNITLIKLLTTKCGRDVSYKRSYGGRTYATTESRWEHESTSEDRYMVLGQF